MNRVTATPSLMWAAFSFSTSVGFLDGLREVGGVFLVDQRHPRRQAGVEGEADPFPVGQQSAPVGEGSDVVIKLAVGPQDNPVVFEGLDGRFREGIGVGVEVDPVGPHQQVGEDHRVVGGRPRRGCLKARRYRPAPSGRNTPPPPAPSRRGGPVSYRPSTGRRTSLPAGKPVPPGGQGGLPRSRRRGRGRRRPSRPSPPAFPGSGGRWPPAPSGRSKPRVMPLSIRERSKLLDSRDAFLAHLHQLDGSPLQLAAAWIKYRPSVQRKASSWGSGSTAVPAEPVKPVMKARSLKVIAYVFRVVGSRRR